MQSCISMSDTIISNDVIINTNDSECRCCGQASLTPEGAREQGSGGGGLSSPLPSSNWADNAPHCPAAGLTLRV